MEDAIRKADVLIEALPYIKKFHKKVVVIKYGGSILGDEKIRNGAKTTRHYRSALTPYRRVLACPEIDAHVKKRLADLYAKLNPADLKRRIDSLRRELYRSVK